MLASSCEAPTFSLVRESWATLQADPGSSFAELPDNFLTNGADVYIKSPMVNGALILTVEGASRVHDPAQLFCLGQPSTDHGGALNQKGHGLKIFQAAFDCDVMVYVRREEVSQDGTTRLQHYLVRHGPQHDKAFHLSEDVSPTIKITHAPIDLKTGAVQGICNDKRAVTVGLYTQNPMCQTDVVTSNVANVLKPFHTFPETGDYVLFVYWGFNRNPSRPRLTLDGVRDKVLCLNGEPLQVILARKYLLHHDDHSSTDSLPNIYINSVNLKGLPPTADDFVMMETKEYTLHLPEYGDVKYTMTGGWPKKLVDGSGCMPKNRKFNCWPNCGALLHHHGRVVHDDPKHWMNLYDTACGDDAKYGCSFTALSYGGKLDICKRRAVEIFKAHLDATALPFTDAQCGQIYDHFKRRFGFGRAAWYLLLGTPALFIINAKNIKLTVSKEALMNTLDNGAPTKLLLKHIRYEQVRWCFEHIKQIGDTPPLLLTTLPTLETSDDTAFVECHIHEDDDGEEEEEEVIEVEQAYPVVATPKYTTTGRQRKATRVFTSDGPARTIKKPRKKAMQKGMINIKKKLREVVKRYNTVSDPTIVAIVLELRSLCD